MAVDLSSLKRQVAERGRERVERATRSMTSDLKRTAPVDTGELQRRTGVDITSATRTRVSAEAVIDVTYAEVVVHGSRPHVIRPRTRQALAFYWPKKGATVVLASVNHPGTQPNPFFERVVSQWGEYLERAV